MSSTSKCKNCGGSEIDVDPARGDAVCTNCGSVLESSIIVSTIQFEDNAHGGSSAIGQFVSSDSKGGPRGFGGSLHTALGVESREITLRNAKKKITDLAHQMRLNQHCIETAFNFFKMALSRHLTRGRKTGNVIAACVYITCRTEGTAHMLIDFCDVLDGVTVYELGRTYLRLSQALCINIPASDPCMYILRFANRLEFGEKTHEVSMTALRLVQRMKKDHIHAGRRPAGLCGAALLMAARLHDYNRTVTDIIKIVKVHESTLRKRLLEFGDTPSSSLTLDEFMAVDLEEDQDPPSFKASRRKDQIERYQKAIEDDDLQNDLTLLQIEIERELDRITKNKKHTKMPAMPSEDEETRRFVEESTMEVIQDCITSNKIIENKKNEGIAPSLATLGLGGPSISSLDTKIEVSKEEDGHLVCDDLDDDELNQYIMTSREAGHKDKIWNKINETYLKEQKDKEEKLAKEREEGKPEKKRRKYVPKKQRNPANTPGEAIEKMLQEKKISMKINYDVLKSLNLPPIQPVKEPEEDLLTRLRGAREIDAKRKKKKTEKVETKPKETLAESENEIDEDLENEEQEPEPEKTEVSLQQLLNQHRDDGDFYGAEYEDEDY